MEIKEAIKFLGELRESFLDVEKMSKEISSRILWNKYINGLNQVIWLLKEKEKNAN